MLAMRARMKIACYNCNWVQLDYPLSTFALPVHSLRQRSQAFHLPCQEHPQHCKNIRISTGILRRVCHILTEPVPYTFVSVNRCNNNEARARIAMNTNVYGTAVPLKYGQLATKYPWWIYGYFYSAATNPWSVRANAPINHELATFVSRRTTHRIAYTKVP